MSHVDINEAVRNTLIVATNEYKYVADVTTDLGNLPLVECNAGDINQVLINLIVNSARDRGLRRRVRRARLDSHPDAVTDDRRRAARRLAHVRLATGDGTTFVVRLPVRAAVTPDREAAAA